MANLQNLPDRPSAIALLEDIRRLALEERHLDSALRGAVGRLAAGLDGARVTIAGTADAGIPPVVAGLSADDEGAPVLQCAMFQIERDGRVYGFIRVEQLSGEMASDGRDFASVAAELLAGAFVRVERVGEVKFAGVRITPQLELIHRVRNILSMVRIVVRKTGERAESVEDYAAQLDGRISALARVHTAMIADPAGSTDLGTLIEDEKLAQLVSENRMSAKGPRVPLKAKTAETLGLTFHELIENAIKYGALSSKEGQVEIVWWIDEASRPQQLHLKWVESGVPVLSPAPRVAGFGHELIRQTLPYELAARTKLDFQPGGFRCELAIPLPEAGDIGLPKARM